MDTQTIAREENNSKFKIQSEDEIEAESWALKAELKPMKKSADNKKRCG